MIQHVALEVRREDADACAAFWAILGFAEVPAPAALSQRSTWLQSGPTQIHLLYAGSPVVPVEGHVAVICADYDEALARLRGAGHDVLPRTEYWGAPRCFTRCPAGHRVEVMAAAP